MGNPFDLVSTDAQRALEEFSEDFNAAFTQGAVEPWAKTNGLYRASSSLRTTFPIPVSAAGYKELSGDIKYRSLFQKSLTLKPKTWQDGVSELASIVEAPDFIGWAGQPTAMALAAQSVLNEIVAGLLEDNPEVKDSDGNSWDGKNFFDTGHLTNVLDASVGTFDNDFTGAGTDVTAENLAAAMTHFDELKGANGKPLGLRMTHVFHPPSQRQAWKNLLENDLLITAVGSAFGAVNNIYKGSITPVCVYELTDSDKWYPAALNKPGMYPWVVQDQGAPEEIRQDKTDALYKTTLKVGVAYIMRANGGLALPQCMARFAGQAPA